MLFAVEVKFDLCVGLGQAVLLQVLLGEPCGRHAVRRQAFEGIHQLGELGRAGFRRDGGGDEIAAGFAGGVFQLDGLGERGAGQAHAVQKVRHHRSGAGALAVHGLLGTVRHGVDLLAEIGEGAAVQLVGQGGGDIHRAVLEDVLARALARLDAQHQSVLAAVLVLDIDGDGFAAGKPVFLQAVLGAQVLDGVEHQDGPGAGGYLRGIDIIALVALEGELHGLRTGRGALPGGGRGFRARLQGDDLKAALGVFHLDGGDLGRVLVQDGLGGFGGLGGGGGLLRFGLRKQQGCRRSAQHHQDCEHDQEVPCGLFHRLTGASSSGR